MVLSNKRIDAIKEKQITLLITADVIIPLISLLFMI